MITQAWTECAQALSQGREAALLRRLDQPCLTTAARAALDENLSGALRACPDVKQLCVYAFQGGEYCYQPLSVKPRLVILGGGHVAYHTARVGVMLDFDVTVIDDRAEFANAQRFDFARAVCLPFGQALDAIAGGEGYYFVIATRGHAFDSECLFRILQKPRAYVGMIGSQGKVARIMALMREKGFSEQALSGVYSPIGLKIGAVTPAEIAVSILGQIIMVRSERGGAAYVGDDVIDSIRQKRAVAVATVLSKRGSGPRGPGTVMCLNEDGSISGTVGGGAAERRAIELAARLKKGETALFEYDMTANDAQNLGMVCGGSVRIALESLR